MLGNITFHERILVYKKRANQNEQHYREQFDIDLSFGHDPSYDPRRALELFTLFIVQPPYYGLYYIQMLLKQKVGRVSATGTRIPRSYGFQIFCLLHFSLSLNPYFISNK